MLSRWVLIPVLHYLCFGSWATLNTIEAYSLSPKHSSNVKQERVVGSNTSRRALGAETFRKLVAGTVVANTLAVSALTSSPRVALAADDNADPAVDVYFGVGCFWHIQHEFVEAERKLLGRSDADLTSRTGYAGGSKTDNEGRVCYHNFQGVADYGKLGHGEVVGMTLPSSKVADFAAVYFSLFNPKTGERVDPLDKGGEYRSLIGLPQGSRNPLYEGIARAAQEAGFRLEQGKGNDPDTFGNNKLVYVYDSNKFPFYQAEVYHQFHNDFQSPAYGKEYNGLANLALDDGRIRGTGCPDRV